MDHACPELNGALKLLNFKFAASIPTTPTLHVRAAYDFVDPLSAQGLFGPTQLSAGPGIGERLHDTFSATQSHAFSCARL